MATKKQIEANRRNAKLSAGPRTTRGKAASAMNALKTGIFAKHLLLPDDNSEEFGQIRGELYREWQPMGPTETHLVERLVALFWRQQRFCRAESGLYTMYRQCPEGIGGVATALARDGQDTEAFSRLQRSNICLERSIDGTIQQLQKLQENRDKRAGLKSVERSPRSQSDIPTSINDSPSTDCCDYPQI